MKKLELVARIAEKGEITKKSADEILDLVCGVVAEALAEGEKGDTVPLPKLGKFEIGYAEDRNCNNIHTGETMVIPAHGTVKFKVGQPLKDAVK